MNDALRSLLDAAIADLRRHESATLPLVTLRHVVSRYRDRRGGFTGDRYLDELRGYFGSDLSSVDAKVGDLSEIVASLHEAVANDPVGRAYLSVLAWRAEEPAFTLRPAGELVDKAVSAVGMGAPMHPPSTRSTASLSLRRTPPRDGTRKPSARGPCYGPPTGH